MARKNKPGAGRPPIPFEKKELDQAIAMARMLATAEEMASVLGMSADTLDKRLKEHGYANFSEFYERHSAEGKASLRRAQYQLAMSGNVTMLVWLGKVMLNQKEVRRTEISDPEGNSPWSGNKAFAEAVLSTLASRHGVIPAGRPPVVEDAEVVPVSRLTPGVRKVASARAMDVPVEPLDDFEESLGDLGWEDDDVVDPE